jgi:hypothetical protein
VFNIQGEVFQGISVFILQQILHLQIIITALISNLSYFLTEIKINKYDYAGDPTCGNPVGIMNALEALKIKSNDDRIVSFIIMIRGSEETSQTLRAYINIMCLEDPILSLIFCIKQLLVLH